MPSFIIASDQNRKKLLRSGEYQICLGESQPLKKMMEPQLISGTHFKVKVSLAVHWLRTRSSSWQTEFQEKELRFSTSE